MYFNSKKYINILYIIFILYISNKVNQAEINEEENIDKLILEYRKKFSKIKAIILTDKNYTKYIQSNPYTLLYFHSVYDQNSIDFMPTFKFINDYLNGIKNYSRYLTPKVAAIDLSDDENNSEIQSHYRLSAFPYFIIFSSIYNKYIQYTGYMTAQSIITFSMKATLDNILTIHDEKIFNLLLNPKLIYLSVFSMRSNFNFDEYYKVSQKFKFALFADCIGQNLCKNYFNESFYKSNDIIISKMNLCKNDFICEEKPIKDNDSKPYFIPYNYTSFDDFIEFISLNIMPTIHNLTDFNFEIMNKNTLNTIIYIIGKNEKKSKKEISLILEKIIDNKKYKISWGSIVEPINSQNDYENVKLLSIEVEDYEQKGLVLIHSSNKITKEKEVYRMKNDELNNINEESIIRFVNEYNSGIIKRDIKSEIIPKFHPKKNLRMVVGKTFEKEILNNNNKTIVLILVTLDMDNLHEIEDQIESLTIKFGKFNQTIIFNFLDPALNEMPDMPKYDIMKRPYYRYYYKDKKKGFVDFKGKNILDQSQIENWIIDNYGKEYGVEYTYEMRMHVEGLSELLKDKKVLKEFEKKQKIEQLKEDLGIKDDINLEEGKNEQKKETDL